MYNKSDLSIKSHRSMTPRDFGILLKNFDTPPSYLAAFF